MEEADPELEKLGQILADPDAERELKIGRLEEAEFFSKSPERAGFLLRWFLEARSPDAHLYFAANQSLGRLIEEGAKFLEEDLCRIRDAAEGKDGAAKNRASGILKMMRGRLEMEETQRFRKFLSDEAVPREKKAAMMGYSDYIASRRENADVLVEFLTGAMCDDGLFGVGIGTYIEINQGGKGLHITDVQLSHIGRMLRSPDEATRERGERMYKVAALHVPRGLLEHPDIPEGKKVEMLGEKERFTSDMPRSVSVLVDFMLDSDLCSVNERIRQAARNTFQGLVEGGILLTEYHMKRIVGMMVADPSLDILQAEQRENAFWMLRQLVMNGFEIPRNHQGRMMKAAGEVWPRVKDEPRKEEWRLKKLYGLKGIELILAVWLVELKEGRKSGWPFRPEDRALISYDTSHEDRELRDASIRVDALIDEIDDEISAVESAAMRIAAVKRARGPYDDILREYVKSQAPAGEAGKDAVEKVFAEAEREADEELAKAGADARPAESRKGKIEVAKVEPRRVSRPPRADEPDCEMEVTPLALSRQVLERQAAEATKDKPGLPPEIERALRRMESAKVKKDGKPAEEAGMLAGRLWPPTGAKK